MNDLSPQLECWKVVGNKVRGKTQQHSKPPSKKGSKVSDQVEFKIHLNHFSDVEPIPFDILVDVPDKNCINCLGPRHFKCDKPQNHDYCFNCGRSGVRVTKCPRCRNAYPAYLQRRKKEGFGRKDETKATPIDEVQNKPEGSVYNEYSSLQSAPLPVLKENQDYPSIPTVIEKTSWPSVAESLPIASNVHFTNNNDLASNDRKFVGSETRFQMTNNYLHDVTNIMERIKSLPVSHQNSIILQFISARQKLLDQVNKE